jgi:predicted metal-dependent hydrolase
MRLRVDPRTGTILLTLPRRVSRERALEWAASQRGWIEAALADIPDSIPLTPGSSFPLRGDPHLIEWIEGTPRTVHADNGRVTLGGPRDAVPSRLSRWLRQHAQQLLAAETEEFARAAGVTIERVAVSDPVSRWGSCSESGTIRYSWRLVLAPDWVRRATVAHEVAHRVHMNHGREFHLLVEKLLGCDPAPARQWLRRHGAALHGVGRV